MLCPVYKKKQVWKENSLHDLIKNRELVYDNIGRPHLITPRSGYSKVYLKAHKLNSTTIATHITDIYNFINENYAICNKTSLTIMSDSVVDFCPSSVLNMICYYRLFTYTPRYSVFNCIEHLCSPLSNKLSGVVFSNIASGDSKPPNQLSL